MEYRESNTSIVLRLVTMVFTFFTALSTGYIAYMLYRFVDALQQMSNELTKLSS